MGIQLAIKTLDAIATQIESDQGAKFRTHLGQVIPHIGDAYRGEDSGFRSHLGASMIGRPCGRSLWFNFRWVKKARFSGRMLRLFNRGHLEEARFIAMFLAIGCQVYQQDANGNQFRISELGGHFGGSGDGVIVGIPDLPPNTPALAEFKTHNLKSFTKLQKSGVREAKFEHFVQMQMYMRKMQLPVAIYGAVCKDNDELHLEIVYPDQYFADQYLERGRTIVMMRQVPEPIKNASPGLFDCKYCDYNGICYDREPPEHNCRTCVHSEPRADGTWWCGDKKRHMAMSFGNLSDDDHTPGETLQLSKERQLKGCKTFYASVM